MTLPSKIASLIIAILITSLCRHAINGQNSSTTDKISSPTYIYVIYSNNDSIVINLELGGYELNNIKTQRKGSVIPVCEGGVRFLIKDAPDLIKFCRSVIIPDDKEMDLEIISSSYTDFKNITIAPSFGNIKRTDSLKIRQLIYGEIYSKNEFFPGPIAKLNKHYTFRDFSGQNIVFQPFQYNPVSQVLRVYHQIKIAVFAPKINPSSQLTVIQNVNSKQITSAFDGLYKKHFINYSGLKGYKPVKEYGKMLIISHPDFLKELEPLQKWKTERGIQTQLVNVKEIGDTTEIKKFIIQYFLKNRDLTFILLAGDAAQIRPLYRDGDSDLAYGQILGNDVYPEVIVGRFSAESIEDIRTQVQRTIEYEKYPALGDDWYKKAVLIGSQEGPGHFGEYDFEHMQNIKKKLAKFGFSKVDELYDGSHGGDDKPGNPTIRMLTDILNEGRGILNYIGHGFSRTFETTGFSNKSIFQLKNVKKLPFIFDVACENGRFRNDTCMAEAWMRAQSNNNPTGAIAVYASSVEQDWDPPMTAHDEMIDILTETYTDNIKRTFGGIVINGCLKMNVDYEELGPFTTNNWIIFGDPSLMLRTNIPSEFKVKHQEFINYDSSKFYVETDIKGAQYSFTNDTLVKCGIIENNSSTINFSNLQSIDTLKFCLTGYNKFPYFAKIPVFASYSSYLNVKGYTINDSLSNNNGIAESGETITLDPFISNEGRIKALNIKIILSTTDPYIQVKDSIANVDSLNPKQYLLIKNRFKIRIAEDVPDKYIANFTLKFIDNRDSSWIHKFAINISAPKLDLVFFKIDDYKGNNNGRLEVGETANIIISATNTGNVSTSILFCKMVCIDTNLLVNKDTAIIQPLKPGNKGYALFNISLSENIPYGQDIKFQFNIKSGNYVDTLFLTKKLNLMVEDWETGDFSQHKWQSLGKKQWMITTTCKNGGKFSVKSEKINDSDSSGISLNIDVINNDSILFYKKVSSEINFDELKFYINDTLKGHWSGEIDWSLQKYFINKGKHKLKWIYKKDFIKSQGIDGVWLDDIILPTHISVNSSPVMISQPLTIAKEKEQYNYRIRAKEFDLGDKLYFNLITGPDWLTLNTNSRETGILWGTPSKKDVGSFPVFISITDGIDTIYQKFTIKVDKADYVEPFYTENLKLVIQPNPAKNNSWLYIENPERSDLSVSIYDQSGRQVKSILPVGIINPGKIYLPMNFSAFPPGFYLCKIKIDDNLYYLKFIISD